MRNKKEKCKTCYFTEVESHEEPCWRCRYGIYSGVRDFYIPVENTVDKPILLARIPILYCVEGRIFKTKEGLYQAEYYYCKVNRSTYITISGNGEPYDKFQKRIVELIAKKYEINNLRVITVNKAS